eukprot:CAMPEP_0176448354 /NCGR_PEP_ID=MMETSP0127-20121128/25710_1 /TAXON_ID=938130 /ORGANISM="Platyophrya macrostoma, Strain WH" /LENGTH=158 /DNA_ID=CAMNT_0017835241 /DNA_START=105 /DNA_END=581 /DNA_ORIENTATION=-
MFETAEPLALPVVKMLLTAKMEDMRQRVKAHESTPSYVMMQKTRDVAEELQDFCASQVQLQKIANRLLRVKSEGEHGSLPNAHLANLEVDDDGNVVGMGGADLEESAQQNQRQTLKPYEAVQLATLVPQNVHEAVALIPSLAIYDEGDLHHLLEFLQQ